MSLRVLTALPLRVVTGPLLLTGGIAAPAASAQRPSAPRDAVVRAVVESGGQPVLGAIVRTIDRTPPVAALTDELGRATLSLAAGDVVLVTGRLGFAPDTLRLLLRDGQDTSVRVALRTLGADLETVVITSTRSSRRLEDTPLRVEVIDEEEIAEKVAMTPGDIAMMLNETAGLRVQTTNPALGGANVRIQGLRGRYALILADGLPLYGGQAGGLGLLQIPPVDLGRVEIIKGAASALYGSTALGGVIDLVSMRPGASAERTLLVNQTSRGGTDAVYFGSGPLSPVWGYSLLAGAHRQAEGDVDDDGWVDLAGYERLVVRPRFFHDDGDGRTAFITAGFTGEGRDGGTTAGGRVADGTAFDEALRTRRADVGVLARQLIGGTGPLAGSVLSVRGSAMRQRHTHRFGPVREADEHRTWFAEASIAVPRVIGAATWTWVFGAAMQQDVYRNDDVDGVRYDHRVPAVFAQLDVDPSSWLSLSASARLDAHNVFGTLVNPRLSLLLHGPAQGALTGWTTRLSAGTATFAPTPFTEETEATGLTPLRLPAGGLPALAAERARSVSLDVGGPVETAFGRLEVNATAFASRVADALLVQDVEETTAEGARRLALVSAPRPTRTGGTELLVRFTRPLGGGAHGSADDQRDAAREHEGAAEGVESEGDESKGEEAEQGESPMLRINGSWTWLRSTECDPARLGSAPATCVRREVPLTPRHAAGVVIAVEREGRDRVGLELYYTGRQALADNPFRDASRPYLLVGVLAERHVATPAGVARVFVNFENLTDVRQTRTDPLTLPARGPGGRWTTDAWTDLVGFTVNAGVRFGFGGADGR